MHTFRDGDVEPVEELLLIIRGRRYAAQADLAAIGGWQNGLGTAQRR